MSDRRLKSGELGRLGAASSELAADVARHVSSYVSDEVAAPGARGVSRHPPRWTVEEERKGRKAPRTGEPVEFRLSIHRSTLAAAQTDPQVEGKSMLRLATKGGESSSQDLLGRPYGAASKLRRGAAGTPYREWPG